MEFTHKAQLRGTKSDGTQLGQELFLVEFKGFFKDEFGGKYDKKTLRPISKICDYGDWRLEEVEAM